MVRTPLPGWVFRLDGVYKEHSAYSPSENAFKPRSELPVYKTQLLQDVLFGETRDYGLVALPHLWRPGRTVREAVGAS